VQVGPRYELIRYLGAGSFSRVCAARDQLTGTVVRQPPSSLTPCSESGLLIPDDVDHSGTIMVTWFELSVRASAS
jgi:serine/threonine protein kinase